MSDASTPPSENEQRGFVERRQRPTPMLSRWTLVGRRKAARRGAEAEYVYVDRPGGWILGAFLLVVGLSCLDAWYTLALLGTGKGIEANPVMRAALHLGDAHFVIIKTAITILAVGFLCLHKNWPLGRACLALAILGYSLLLVYHLFVQRHAAHIPMTPAAVVTAPLIPG